MGADGVVLAKKIRFIELHQHHPVCAMNCAARHFLDRAATPPLLRRGRFARLPIPSPLFFLHTMFPFETRITITSNRARFDRAYGETSEAEFHESRRT
jgi:hypothetical protein